MSPPGHAPLPTALIGAGGFGSFVASALHASDAVRLIAVADPAADRAAAVAAGAEAFGDYRSMLLAAAPELTVVATPPYLHAPMALAALAAGSHVLVEKPLATTLADARALLEAAEHAGRRVGVDYVLRYHPLHALVLRLLDAGCLGAVRLWALENFAAGAGIAPDHWFWDHARSGGILVEHGVHFFDLALAAVGRPVDHVAGGHQRRADGRADRAWAVARMGDAAVATFFHSFTAQSADERASVRIATTNARIRLDGWIPTRLAIDAALPPDDAERARALLPAAARVTARGRADGRVALGVELPHGDRQQAYRDAVRAAVDDLADAIRTGRAPAVTPDEAYASLELALAASSRPVCSTA